MFARNQETMDSFFSRKDAHGGLNLSQKVWKYTGQLKEEMELALSASLGQGDSAATVSRHVRQYLREPDRLFRRVRDAQGNLKLSKRAAAYHPGRGEYRSSYKNAMRLTRTETNMAYRAADCDRWSRIPFVVGMEVKRSNHPFGCEVCEALKGKYPKDFVFTGWHPQCRCYIVPVLASEEERMAYHRAVLNGEDVSDFHFKGEITEPHEDFKKWVSENQERIGKAAEKGTLPYWMKDNPQYVVVKPTAQAEPVKDIHDQMDTMPPELRARIDLRNERVREYKRLLDDPDYKNVQFDEKSGGVYAEHRLHSTQDNNKELFFGNMTGFDLEKEFADIAFHKGHSVIMRQEGTIREIINKIEYLNRELDTIIDGRLADIASVTKGKESYEYKLLKKNGQLIEFNAQHGEDADTVIFYFHDQSMYSEKRIHDSIEKLFKLHKPAKDEMGKPIKDANGKQVYTDETYEISIKHIICVTKTGIWKEYHL